MKNHDVLAMLVAGLLALAAFVGPGGASDRRAPAGVGFATAGACKGRVALKKLFPRARAVNFSHRDVIQWNPRRRPLSVGWCGSWWTTYSGYLWTPARPVTARGRPTTDVSVTLYKTRRGALAAYFEPFAPLRADTPGVPIRWSIADGELGEVVSVASVVRNVVVFTTAIWPERIYSARQERRAGVRIHRWIHAAVLRSRRSSAADVVAPEGIRGG